MCIVMYCNKQWSCHETNQDSNEIKPVTETLSELIEWRLCSACFPETMEQTDNKYRFSIKLVT